MFDKPIQDILTQRLQALPEFVRETSLRKDIDELVARYLPTGRIAVIDDVDTAAAYGDLVFKALKSRYDTTHITLARHTEANDTALNEITIKSSRADLLIAAGSGTINDLVKYAAHQGNKPYVLIPTAASMNGYVSATASLTIRGHKQSLPATLPKAVLIDLQVIAEAPTRLSQAGLGDSLARPTAQADWLLSHHLLGTEYDDDIYRLTKPYETAVFSQAEGIRRGDKQAISALLDLLLLSGFGMTMAKSSVPASGAEHMLAHAYHMGIIPPTRINLHGEEIAFATLVAATIQEQLLAAKLPHFATSAWNKDINKIFSVESCAAFEPLYEKKRNAMLDQFPAGEISGAQWETAREAIASVHIQYDMLALICKQAGLPMQPEPLGWDAHYFEEMIGYARFTRDRFTCLDLVQ